MIKKLFLLMVISIAAISCTTDEYYTDPINTYSRDFTINENQWIWYPDQAYYYCDVNIQELTPYIYNNGTITTFYLADIGGDEVSYPLPYDYFVDGNDGKWTEQSTCEITPGAIRFVFQYDDLQDFPTPPELTFRVKMMW